MECPYAKSDKTPCVRRDEHAWAYGGRDYRGDPIPHPICVGCERPPSRVGVTPPEKFMAEYRRYLAEQDQ